MYYVIDDNLLIGTGAGIFISENNGASWASFDLGLTIGLLLHCKYRYNRFRWTFNGVYRRTSSENFWVKFNNGLTNFNIYSLL